MSAGLYSSISESYSQILPNARSYNTITNPVFVRNDANPVSVSNGKVGINGALLVTGGMEVDGSVALTGTLQHAYNNPDSFAEVYTSYVSSGTTNASERANYVLYNGNSTTGGVEASTLQMFAYTPSGGLNYNFQIRPDGSVYVPTSLSDNMTVQNFQVSTINGAPITPSAGNGTYFSTITATFANTSNQVVATFPNIPPDSICEGFCAGAINWTSAPSPADLFTINFSGGGPQTVDNLAISVPIPSYAIGANNSNGVAYFNLGGFFQTSATATNATLNFRGNVALPADYTVSFFNGNIRYVSPQ